MAVRRSCDRELFEGRLERNIARRELGERILAIRDAHIDDVKIPDDLMQDILNKANEHENPPPRIMRDVVRMIALMKSHALLNFQHRKRRGNVIIANKTDVASGIELYAPIKDANERGVPPQVWDFYHNVLSPTLRALSEEDDIQGVTRKEFVKLWFETFNESLGHRRQKQIRWLMDSAGLISEGPDPEDKRRSIISLNELNATGLGIEKKKTLPKKKKSSSDIAEAKGMMPQATIKQSATKQPKKANRTKLTKKELRFLREHTAGSGFEPAADDLDIVNSLLVKKCFSEKEGEPGIYAITELGEAALRGDA